MKKRYTCILFFWCFLHLHGQVGLGTIRIYGFANTDNHPKNNFSIDSVDLLVIDYKGDTLINGPTKLPCFINSCMGEKDYLVSASYQSYETIHARVRVNSDRISFVELLFEPVAKKRKNFVTAVKNKQEN